MHKVNGVDLRGDGGGVRSAGGGLRRFQQGVQAGKDAIALQQIGTAYRKYCQTNKKGPANVDDLLKSATTQDEKDAVNQIKDGKYTAVWGLDVTDPKVGTNNIILVYTATATNGIRVVLMADCKTVTSLSEADFQSKSKNKPESKNKLADK